MAIDKIGQINGLNDYNKIKKTGRVEKSTTSDSVSISQEALNSLENKKIMDLVQKAPDVRADKIKEIKEKLKDPNYINDKVMNTVADNIVDLFDI